MVSKWCHYGGTMVAITLRNIPPELYEDLKQQARVNHRSLNGEILVCLELAMKIKPLNVEETMERARRIRELTADYVATGQELLLLV
jgi:hypothetical protein